MFTGIVRGAGRVTENRRGRLAVSGVPGRPGTGASVAVDGVCLTVVSRRGRLCRFDVSRETMALTTLGSLKPGDKVNLEPALRASDPLGGHLVAGHVDARAEVLGFWRNGDGSRRLKVSLPAALEGLVARKGSVAVDGVSLTVTTVGRGWFETALVPHTLKATTLGAKKAGDAVNLEADLVARYVESVLRQRR